MYCVIVIPRLSASHVERAVRSFYFAIISLIFFNMSQLNLVSQSTIDVIIKPIIDCQIIPSGFLSKETKGQSLMRALLMLKDINVHKFEKTKRLPINMIKNACCT